jgi:hypothetical protein
VGGNVDSHPLLRRRSKAYYANYGCAAALVLGTVGTAEYLKCIGAAAGGGFYYGILDNVFGIGSMGGAACHSQACNSIEQARMTMYQHCQPVLP